MDEERTTEYDGEARNEREGEDDQEVEDEREGETERKEENGRKADDGRKTEDDERTKRTVELPERVLSRVEDRLPRTEFDSSDEYVAFVLEEVLYHVGDRTDEGHEAIDEEEVHRRLESLGYLSE